MKVVIRGIGYGAAAAMVVGICMLFVCCDFVSCVGTCKNIDKNSLHS